MHVQRRNNGRAALRRHVTGKSRCGEAERVKSLLTTFAALESAVKQLAAEHGADKITCNALSPGPIPTRAASGLPHFDELLENARKRNALGGELATIDDVGALATFLASDNAARITGGCHFVDSGYNFIH